MHINKLLKNCRITPFENQYKILEESYSKDYKRIFCKIGMRGGSTTLCSLFAYIELLCSSKIAIISSGNNQCNYMKDIVKRMYGEVHYYDCRDYTEMRGTQYDAIIMDAFDFFIERMSRCEIHNLIDICMNSILERDGKIVICSPINRNNRGSVYEELCNKYSYNLDTYIAEYNTWEINPHLSKEKLYNHDPDNFKKNYVVKMIDYK